jgi:hypothetical protein
VEVSDGSKRSILLKYGKNYIGKKFYIICLKVKRLGKENTGVYFAYWSCLVTKKKKEFYCHSLPPYNNICRQGWSLPE